MGEFSWIYSDINRAMKSGRMVSSYLLVPKKYQNKYGRYIEETHYDGYGNIGSYDVYDLVAEWNREYLSSDMLRKPKREKFGENDFSYEAAMRRYERSTDVLKKYREGASDSEMKEYCKDFWGSDWKRNIGIEIACYDEQNFSLPYPIKITSKPIEYESAKPSKGDPNQGW